jgi:hypothetical protein
MPKNFPDDMEPALSDPIIVRGPVPDPEDKDSNRRVSNILRLHGPLVKLTHEAISYLTEIDERFNGRDLESIGVILRVDVRVAATNSEPAHEVSRQFTLDKNGLVLLADAPEIGASGHVVKACE